MNMDRGPFPKAMIGRGVRLLWVVVTVVSCSFLPGVMAIPRVSIDLPIREIGGGLASESRAPPSVERQHRAPLEKLQEGIRSASGNPFSPTSLGVINNALDGDIPNNPNNVPDVLVRSFQPMDPSASSSSPPMSSSKGGSEGSAGANQTGHDPYFPVSSAPPVAASQASSDGAASSHPTEQRIHSQGKTTAVLIGVITAVVTVVGVVGVALFVAAKRRRQMQPRSDSMGRLRSANDKAVFLWRQRQESGSLRQYTFAEIETATQQFSTAKLLGKGSFGDVYEGDFEGIRHCVKFRAQGATAVLRDFRKDVFKVSGISHKHVAKVIGFCDDSDYQALVGELAPNGTLEDYHLYGKLKDHPLDWRSRLRILAGAAAGVEHIHGRSILHCHLKSTNIILDINREAKVADYGLFKPRLFNDKYHSDMQYFTGYIDPEYLQKDQCVEVDKRSDVFSFGVVLLETVSGRPSVFAGDGDTHVLLTEWARELQRNGDYKSIVDPRLISAQQPAECARGVIDLALSCVDVSPQSRPTMKQVRHRLLKLEEYAGNDMLRSMSTPMSTGQLSTAGQVSSIAPMGSTGQISTCSHISSMDIHVRGNDNSTRT